MEDFAFYDHTVYEFYPNLDDELFPLAASIGRDLGTYRNHCLRVLTFTNYFLPESTKRDLPDAMDLAATAIAYHRIGLWTDKSVNYLDSSKDKLEVALGDSFRAEKLSIMSEIILQQHKMRDFTSMGNEAENSLINAVRKASWADTTMGLIRFDLPASLLETAYNELEGDNFHAVILGLITKLSPNILNGVMEVGQIIKW
eukprot:CAMPEP_0197181668 /NCGR_PEP_ID=MMETSP1423-20130617/5888_1 /TAXON_ID=476441 /ORGANISM="Pseudo-nitzschia heimii, Strain UNC1101" /LENGTH=199 /DNA_ID=CAMNT_0042631961 /DNA_START=154 /DNA_END=753 /DNA_ORIENTATION=+